MKIDGFHIDGYGVHHDLGVTDLPDGLTIIAGPNEAGKTTLQHFLVGMLFGFTATNRPDHHAPLRGGTYGGRLFVTDRTGRPLTIHRGARRSSLHVTGPEGPVPDAELSDLLGGATKDLYQSIFAVHLEELAELKALSDEQVRDRVFSAGVLGAGRTAQRALAQLADERDALLKPGGRSPDKYLIKRLRAQLVEARAELAEVRRASKGLPALTSRLTVLDRDRAQVRAERQVLLAERSLLAAVADLWPAWTDAAEARSELHRLGVVAEVPADARERLARAAARVRDLDEVRESTAQALHEAAAQLEAIVTPGPALAHQPAIAELVAGAPVGRERLATIAELQVRADHLTADLTATLTALGPGCDEAWLADRPERPEAAAELRTRAARVAAAEQHRTHVVELHRRTHAELDDAQAELDAAEAAAAARPAHSVERARQAVDDATALASLVSQHDAAARRVIAAEAADRAPTTGPSLPPFLVPVLLGLGALVVLAGAGAAASGAVIAGSLAALGGLALAAVGVALRRMGATPATAAEPRGDAAATATAELASLDIAIAPLLRSLGLQQRPTITEAASIANRAQQLAAEAQQLHRDRGALDERRHALVERRRRLDERRAAEQADADAELDAATSAWQAWLHDQGLPSSLDAAGAADVLDALASARAAARTLATTRADLQRAQGLHTGYVEQLRTLLERTGLATTADPHRDPMAAVDELRAELAAAQQAQRAVHEATIALDGARRAHDHADARASAAHTELASVLASIGATTLDQAATIVERATQAQELRRTIARAEHDLATVVGANTAQLDAARTLLQQADPIRWRDELHRLGLTLRATDDRVDDLTTEIAHLERERDQLERSADVPTLELRVSDLEAQLVDAVSRWASLTVAHQLVEGTLARYQRERQPEVVTRAAARFEQITGGRYRRLEVRDHEVVAIDHAEREIPAAALSKGSVEQLYLCMRFALAESFARTAPLPLLLDDIIVNADGDRMAKLAETIASVADHHQVFVFTCHDATVELLQGAAPSARLLTLEPSSGARRMGLAAG